MALAEAERWAWTARSPASRAAQSTSRSLSSSRRFASRTLAPLSTSSTRTRCSLQSAAACPQENQCEGRCIRGKKSEPCGHRPARALPGRPARACQQAADEACNGKKVAVIGSGPSGITCAGELATALTSLSSRHSSPAAACACHGIPEFRLPKAVAKREIDGLKELGVRSSSTLLWATWPMPTSSLGEKGFDAIYVATGAGLLSSSTSRREPAQRVLRQRVLTRVNLMKANKFPSTTPPPSTPSRSWSLVAVTSPWTLSARQAPGCRARHYRYRRTEARCPPVAPSFTTPRPRASRLCRLSRRLSSSLAKTATCAP